MVSNLRAVVVSLGEDILGIKKEDIGMHLIRSSAAMVMYLGNYRDYSITIKCCLMHRG